MPPNQKTAKACKAMEDYGFAAKKVKAALKQLLKVYNDRWELIQDENYKVLLEFILEMQREENERMEPKKSEASPHHEVKGTNSKKKKSPLSEPSSKRLCLRHQKERTSASVDKSTLPLALIPPKRKPDDVMELSSGFQSCSEPEDTEPQLKRSRRLRIKSEQASLSVSKSNPQLAKTSLKKAQQDEAELSSSFQTSSEPVDLEVPLIRYQSRRKRQRDQAFSSQLYIGNELIIPNPVSSPNDIENKSRKADSSQTCLIVGEIGQSQSGLDNERAKSKSVSLQDKGKTPLVIPQVAPVQRKLGSEEGTDIVCYAKKKFERMNIENVLDLYHNKFLDIPSDDPFTDDVMEDEVPLAVVLPAPQRQLCGDGSSQGNSSDIKVDAVKPYAYVDDITRGEERVKISLIAGSGAEDLPTFFYIPQNFLYNKACLNSASARIADEDCCSQCSMDCLLSAIPCACARQTGGEFAYTPGGLLKERFLEECISLKQGSDKGHFIYCKDCPLERSKNKIEHNSCKGHLVRKFIKECWYKCKCSKKCGNRVVQRGISVNLQVFPTPEGKGWGLRTVEDLPKGAFVCEYIGEIVTYSELCNRNVLRASNEKHTYPVLLDADWGTKGVLKDEEALCLDGTVYGNVARFINHRCSDANLIDIPIEVETPDHHYYHHAFFTTRKVAAMEELTWDYGIDFDDKDHYVKAFKCLCGSSLCRGVNR